ncbi:hypothetical protein Hanom_Chr11g00974051 [Helianthus anomalus]
MSGARLCSLLRELGYEGHRTIYPDSFEWPFQYEEDAPAFELSLYFVSLETNQLHVSFCMQYCSQIVVF